MDSQSINGSCLCGAVVFEIRPPYAFFKYCFCSRCRKKTGSAHAANLLIESRQMKWLQGEEKIKMYRMPEVRAFSNCFCSECGSALPWLTKNEKWYVVPAGALNEDPGAKPDENIYWGSRASWYVPENELPCFEEESIK
ncbi:MAG: GFA family protein [Arenimonas sp.]